jgi:hypothetical protein
MSEIQCPVISEKASETTIIVTVEGGVVQSVDGIPAGVTVEVWDFDVEGCDEEDLETNGDGDHFSCAVYRADGCARRQV